MVVTAKCWACGHSTTLVLVHTNHNLLMYTFVDHTAQTLIIESTKMKFAEPFMNAMKISFEAAQRRNVDVCFGIPGVMADPSHLSEEEIAELTAAGFTWHEETQYWIIAVKDMFDAA